MNVFSWKDMVKCAIIFFILGFLLHVYIIGDIQEHNKDNIIKAIEFTCQQPMSDSDTLDTLQVVLDLDEPEIRTEFKSWKRSR